jgi:integrase
MEKELQFSEQELNDWIYTINLHKASSTIIEHNKYAQFFWNCTKGVISSKTLHNYVETTSNHYNQGRWNKLQRFAINFLEFLSAKYSDPDFERKKNLVKFPVKSKPRTLTPWIMVDEDITNLLKAIEDDEKLKEDIKREYRTFVLLLAYTGLRVETAAKLTPEHFKDIRSEKPCVVVNAAIEKNSMERFVPIHPKLVPYLSDVTSRTDGGPIFKSTHLSLQRWLKNHPIMLKEVGNQKIELKGIRKYTEQKNDYLGLPTAISQYILGHGMSGVQWTAYKNYPASRIYDEYISRWHDVDFEKQQDKENRKKGIVELQMHSPEDEQKYIAFLRERYGDEKADEYILSTNIEAYKEWREEESKNAYEDQIKEEEEWSRDNDAETSR